jgi:hypothetical protein
MSWVLGLLLVPIGGVAAGVGLRRAGLPSGQAVRAGLAAGAAVAVVLVALALSLFDECLSENSDPPDARSWPWSPRSQLCEDGSPASLGALAVLLVPVAAVVLGEFLRWRKRELLSWACYALLLATPFLPSLYVDALPVYRLEEYPVLHQPLLRVNTSDPPRVCYVYGIAHGPRKVRVGANTDRICVDLVRTPQALALTAGGGDGGHTVYELRLLGQKLTQEGLPVEAGEAGGPGLVVDRSYKLPESEARRGAVEVE